MTPPGAGALSISADYSEDELDALADLFDVPALGSARLQGPGSDDVVLRAVLASATRSLVARRAVMLTGSALRPKVEFLEPHATLLGTFLGADEIVALRREAPGRSSRLVLFARDHVVVTQQAIAERAILRLTAEPRARLAGLAGELLRLGEAQPFADAEPIATTVPDIDRAERAAHGDGGLGTVEPRLLDVMYARRATCELSVTRQAGGRLEQATIRWIDAGALGLWEIATEPDSHDVSLRPLDPAAALLDLGRGLAEPA